MVIKILGLEGLGLDLHCDHLSSVQDAHFRFGKITIFLRSRARYRTSSQTEALSSGFSVLGLDLCGLVVVEETLGDDGGQGNGRRKANRGGCLRSNVSLIPFTIAYLCQWEARRYLVRGIGESKRANRLGVARRLDADPAPKNLRFRVESSGHFLPTLLQRIWDLGFRVWDIWV